MISVWLAVSCNPRIDTLYGHIRNQFPLAVAASAVAYAAGLALQACRRLSPRLSSSLVLSCSSSHYFSFHCAAAHGCQLAGAEVGAGDAASSASCSFFEDDARPHIDFSAFCLFAYKYPKDMLQILVWLPSAGPACLPACCLPASGYPALSHVRM